MDWGAEGEVGRMDREQREFDLIVLVSCLMFVGLLVFTLWRVVS